MCAGIQATLEHFNNERNIKHSANDPVTAMNGDTIQPETSPLPQGWNEFCERHAITTAKELARQYWLFANENPHHDILAAENFSEQFTDLFQQYFRNEVKEGCAMDQFRFFPFSRVRDYRETGRHAGEDSAGTVAAKVEAEVTAHPEHSELVPSDTNRHSSPKRWSFEELPAGSSPPPGRQLSRFSINRFRQSWRNFFRRKSSDSGPTDNSEAEAEETTSWHGLAKRIFPWTLTRDPSIEVRKEGQLKYGMVDEASMDDGTILQRCRLVLRKTVTSDSDEYVLELFDPPKCSRPKLHKPCSAVQEIRKCTRLEMPDNPNTFLLKVNNSTQVIFETDNDQQLNSWTSEIKECITRGSDDSDVELIASPHADRLSSNPESGGIDSISQGAAHLGSSEQSCHKTDHFLASHPWFHGPISRFRAAQLVQSQGVEGHGAFLVRQSETRRGEYVLTFNFQARAKHLRLSLTERGLCRVQHLWFQSIVEMLHHFRLYPIPLESGAACDVKLSSYVVAVAHPQGPSTSSNTLLFPLPIHRWSSDHSVPLVRSPSRPRAHYLEDVHHSSYPEQIFHLVPPPEELSRSVRNSGATGGHASRQRDSDYEMDSPSRGHIRAIDNQYTPL